MNAISKINNINIKQMTSLISPADLRKSLPVTEEMLLTVNDFRRQIANIIHGKDKRILAIVGPCSIHDRKAALEYADKLKDLQDKVSDKMLVVMRVYFEKPRTTIGWRGLITDPRLDGSFDIAEGLHIARGIMIEILEKGLAVGSEILDPIVPQYISDLISWASIGARTTESQVHREISSGLSMPVGFKNSTDGKFDKIL
jgi:3-deoxy-7-phosphoheptulonate synthase